MRNATKYSEMITEKYSAFDKKEDHCCHRPQWSSNKT